MANLALVYGMRLLPVDELSELKDATVKLKNGREVRVTMHMLEGSKEDIVKQLNQSVEAFFDLFYGEG
jgi:tyrosine-protein phosphatase YwqE